MSSTSSVSQAEYDRLLVSKYRINPATGNAIDPRGTKESHKYKSTQDLHQIGSRLCDTHDLLEETREMLKDGSTSKKKRKEIDKVIDKSIMPMIAIAADAIHMAANITSPIGASKYTHNREEARKKRALSKAQPDKKVKLAMLDNFVQDHASQKPNAKAISKPAAGRRSLPNRKKLPTNPPPVPANGETYGMGEFLQHYFARKTGSERGKFVRSVNEAIIPKTNAKNPHHYVRVARSTIFRTINAHKAGTVFGFDEDWNNVGRRPLLKDKELKKSAAMIKTDPTKKEMRDAVNKILVENLKKRGGAPAVGMEYSSQTVNNYLGEFASVSGVSLANKTVDNTNARHTAERSLIA